MHRLLAHRARFALVFPFVAAVGLLGCSSAGEGEGSPAAGDDGPLGTSAAAITAADAISRAEEWVAAKLLYCQSPNGADDSIDPSCAPVCTRTSNPEWDPYRSDCSGLVSWAWGLPPPGRTTAELAPNQSDITTVIDAADLAMGDAVNTDDSVSSEHHVMLFKAWTTPGQEATFIEEPGCSATPDYAHEFTSTVSISGTSITVDYNGITFQAIRYGALVSSGAGGSSGSSGAPPPTCQVDGVDGTCTDVSVCASMAGYASTPGYCPGPTNEQCCTPTGKGAGGSASGAGGAGTGGAPGAGGAAGSGGDTGNGASAATGTGSGASTGSGPAAHPDVGATSGCQASPGQAGPPAASLAAMAGLLFLTRRRRGSPRSPARPAR